MLILFQISLPIFLFFFAMMIFSFFNAQTALFWFPTSQEKTKNLSLKINGISFAVSFIISLVLFDLSGERARIEKENAEKEKTAQIQKAKDEQTILEQAQRKQEVRQEQEAQEREEERKGKLQAKGKEAKEAKEKPNTKDDEFFEKIKILKANQRSELKELEICEKNTLAQTEKENGKWSSDWDDATKAVYSKRRSQLLDICVNALLAKYNITRNKLSEYEAEQMKKEMDLRKEHYKALDGQ